MKFLTSFIYVLLGWILGHFGIGGLLSINMSYSFTTSFISLLLTFILILNTKNNWNNFLYLIAFSLGSFTGIDFQNPQMLVDFLSISKEHSYFISFFMGIFRLPVVYLILILKVLFLDRDNKITNYFESRVSFQVKIISYSFILTMLQILCEFIFPAQIGYILNEHVDKLNLLPLIGISGYTYLLTYLFTLIAYSIKENKFKNYISYSFIAFFFLFNYSYLFKYDENYNKNKLLSVRLIQYPFHELKNSETFPDKFIKDELYPIIEYGEDIDLILLPEASLPYVYKTYEDFSKILLVKDARKFKRNIQLSLFKEEKDNLYNSSILYKYNRKPEFYYKEQLFPIGEYNPIFYSSLFKRESNWTEMDIKENKKRLFSLKSFNYLPLLCFENYTPSLFIKTDNPWSFVTVQSNESWIFNKKFRRYLLNFIKIRSKEFNTYILKSDTSGPSSIVDNKGNIIVEINKDKEFYDYKIPQKVKNKNELYYKYRELMILFIGLIQILIVFLFNILRKEN